MQDEAMRGIEGPIPVEIKNWAPPTKPPYVKKSSLRTYIMGVDADPISICDYEPKRFRLAIWVIDQPVTLTLDSPVASPDISTASIAPQGGHLPVSAIPHEFFGPDAFNLNSISGSTATRVTVLKEYC